MNVAHAIHGVGLGGAQQVIASIVRGRRDERINYFVYAALDGPRRQEIEEAGATVRILPRVLPKFDPLWVWRLGRAMSRDRIDVVHVHLFGDSLHGYLAARVFGRRPVVLTLHSGTQAWTGLQRLAYPWLLTRCTRLIACSSAVDQDIREACPAVAPTLQLIPNGIEVRPCDMPARPRAELRRSLGVPEEGVVIGAIGRLTPEKGYSYLLSALAKMRSPGSTAPPTLVFLGEGELLEDLRQQARAEGVADRVVFAGFRSDVEALLSAIDVVVFSSFYEGLPIALLEAMAAGRSLIVSDIPGLRNVVRAECEALVVPAANAERLAEALVQLAEDPDLRARLGQAARRRVVASFTADRMVELYEEAYRDLVRGRARPE